MVRLAFLTWLLFNLLGTALLMAYCIIIGRLSFGDVPGMAIEAIIGSIFSTMPLMIGFRPTATALYRKYGLSTARSWCMLYGTILIPATFSLVGACLPAERAWLLAVLSAPYALSFIIIIWILKWPQMRPGSQAAHRPS